MIEVVVNQPVIVFMQMPDGAASKGVRARIRNSIGSLITTISLMHQGDGLYVGSFTPTAVDYYTASQIIYTDGTYTTEDLGYTRRADVYRAVPANSLSIGDLSNISNAVWDESIFSHTLPNTYGLYVSVIRQFVQDNNDELTSGAYGLAALFAEIDNQGLLTRNEVNQNEVKIDAIIPAIAAARDVVRGDIAQVKVEVEAIIPEVDAKAAQIIAEVNQNEVKIDSLAGAVSAIQNNTTVRFIVPEQLIKPPSGNKTYQFHLRLFDEVGNPEAPDFAPTIRVRSLASGLDLVVGAAMTQDGVKVGAYYYDYTISAGTLEVPLLIEATVMENGATRYVPAVTEVTEFQTDLAAIEAQLTVVDSKVSDTQSKVNNPIFGLSALQVGQDNIVNEINQNETLINLVKAKTNLIPADPATLASVAAVGAQVLTRPTLADIQTRLNLLGVSIKGPDARDLTQVYDHFDLSSVAKTNDPRFSYLDAPITSRGTLTASQVWGFGTRTLTSLSLAPSEIAKVWDYLASQAIAPGSIGKLLADNVDTKISTRATQAQVTAALAGVAQQTTLLGLYGVVTTEANQNEILISQVLADTAAIRGKTQNLPSDPASNSVVTAGNISTQTLVVSAQSSINAVKAKTDNLPVDPARQSTLLGVPTNPLLTNDARLTNLDAKISTRGTLNSADITPLAKTSELNSATANLTSEINQNEAKLDALAAVSANIKIRTDLIPNDPARQGTLTAAESAILAAIAAIPSSSGGATPAQIWSYSSRTLSNPDDYKADVSNLATHADVAAAGKTQYENRISTTYNNITGDQEIIAWAEKNGGTVILSGPCTVTVKTSVGVTIWTATLASPNGDGIFRFVNPLSVGVDQNFYIVVSIEVDGDARVSTQPFYSVG